MKIINDNKKYISASQLEPVDIYGNKQYLPTSEDWIEIPISCTGESVAQIATFTGNFDAVTVFNIGDKVRLKQGGAYKYFYVINKSGAYAALNGGSDYAVTTAAITNFAYSRLVNPTGFPPFFNYLPIVSESTGFLNRTTITPTAMVARYSMIGRMVQLFIDLQETLTGVNKYIVIRLPFGLAIGRSDTDRKYLIRHHSGNQVDFTDLIAKAFLGLSSSLNWVTVVSNEVAITLPNESVGFGYGAMLDIDITVDLSYIY